MAEMHRLNIIIKLVFVGCGRGYYSVYPNVTGCECEICPMGTFNSEDFADACISCLPGETTPQPGSSLWTDCRESKKCLTYWHC